MGGPVKTVADKIELLLTEGYTSKKVRSGRGFRTIIWDTAGKQVSDLDAEWEKIRGRVASRQSQRKKAIERRESGGKIVRKPRSDVQKATSKVRDKLRWDTKSLDNHLLKITALVNSAPQRQKFTWNGKLYTKSALLNHVNQLGVGGLEEVKGIWKQIGKVGGKPKTLVGPRHGTALGDFEANKIKLNRLIEQADLTKGRGFGMGHGYGKHTFPELSAIPSNFALETASEGAAKQARATGRDLYEAERRMRQGLGPQFTSKSRAELNYLISVLNAQGKMTPEIQDLVRYFKGLPSVRKYNPGDQYVVTRSGEEVMPTTDPQTGKQKLVSKPGYARNLMTFLRGLPGPAKVAGLPAGILLAGMGVPGRDAWANTATDPYYYADMATGVDTRKLLQDMQNTQAEIDERRKNFASTWRGGNNIWNQ